MHSVRKLVYYCDYCRKYKLTPHSMGVHETHCTLNPNRVCRMPQCVPDEPCPWCQFAEARQSDFIGWDENRDIKAEVETWWAQVHRDYDLNYD